ncbi:MAG: hypothetical protein M1825_003830 [Sarcosagium campestre]|nr:MAG: hypothetical protein M1825_003830 [Sarcosagium campestre]
MSKVSNIPDAWDDDWETIVDKIEERPGTVDGEKETKAERLARHARLNKKLWDSAESEERFHFLEARNEPPLKSDFKPSLKVLSRKPATTSRVDPTTRLAQLGINDYDEDDADAAQKVTLSAEEIRRKTQLDREEKQRRYEEARQRILGKASAAPPANTSPSSSNMLCTGVNIITSRSSSSNETQSASTRGSGRGRGRFSASPRSGSGASTPAQSGETKQLFDPNYDRKTESLHIKSRELTLEAQSSSRESPQRPIRAPRGPEHSGRGGFGFTLPLSALGVALPSAVDRHSEAAMRQSIILQNHGRSSRTLRHHLAYSFTYEVPVETNLTMNMANPNNAEAEAYQGMADEVFAYFSERAAVDDCQKMMRKSEIQRDLEEAKLVFDIRYHSNT